MAHKKKNIILEDNGDWLLIDISTSKYPNRSMAVDSDIWAAHDGGRVFAEYRGRHKYTYARFNINGVCVFFHHSVIEICEGEEADHIVHGTPYFIDNRRANLRSVTHQQNVFNKSIYKNSQSGIKGVTWDNKSNKWKAEIRFKRKKYYLGVFKSIAKARTARLKAERKFFGEFAYNMSNGEGAK